MKTVGITLKLYPHLTTFVIDVGIRPCQQRINSILRISMDATLFVNMRNNLETRPDIDEIKIDPMYDVFTGGRVLVHA